MQGFNFFTPTRIVFGSGRISEISQLILADYRRILLVSERNLANNTPVVSRVKEIVSNSCQVELYLDIEENPSFESVEKGGLLAREKKIDLVIGLGGGSPMDAAKGIAMVATNDYPLVDLISMKNLPETPLPVFCIPTTAGTGSEVTPYAVFTDREGKNKCGYGDDGIFPRVALIDPELTYSMPKSVVVNTGLDVLTHSIEAFLSTQAFPMNDLIALESIREVIKHLPAAARKDHEAMSAMAYASMLGGVAITHGGTILLHIMGYPLTVYHEIPHGRANAILLPAVLDYLRENGTARPRIELIDDLFKANGGVEQFVNSLDVSTQLRDYGIDPAAIHTFAEKVIIKGDIAITPAQVSEEDIVEIYRNKY